MTTGVQPSTCYHEQCSSKGRNKSMRACVCVCMCMCVCVCVCFCLCLSLPSLPSLSPTPFLSPTSLYLSFGVLHVGSAMLAVTANTSFKSTSAVTIQLFPPPNSLSRWQSQTKQTQTQTNKHAHTCTRAKRWLNRVRSHPCLEQTNCNRCAGGQGMLKQRPTHSKKRRRSPFFC